MKRPQSPKSIPLTTFQVSIQIQSQFKDEIYSGKKLLDLSAELFFLSTYFSLDSWEELGDGLRSTGDTSLIRGNFIQLWPNFFRDMINEWKILRYPVTGKEK